MGGIKDLKQKIDQSTMVIKSSTFAGTKPKKGNTGITNITSGQYSDEDKSKKPASPYMVRDPIYLWLDHSRVDRSHINVTTVEDGGIVTDSA